MALLSSPWQVSADILSCIVLGVLVGILRCFFPKRGKLGFCADVLLVGWLLLLLQSYAAGRSYAGEVRWYMAVGETLGSYITLSVLQDMGWRLLGRCAALLFLPLRWAKRACFFVAQKKQQHHVRNKKLKKRKKILKKQCRMLYNSNVKL